MKKDGWQMHRFTPIVDIKRSAPLYQQLYTLIIGEIQSGNLLAGEKLPSKKALSAHLEISQSTIETAYERLKEAGYIESFPRKGFYVRTQSPSGTNRKEAPPVS